MLMQQSLSTSSKRTGSFPSTSLPAPLSQPQWVIKADTWQPTFRSKASAHSEAMGLMSASIILTFRMTLASAYTAITDAWVLSARGGKYNCKSIQVSAQVLLTAITETKSPSESAEVAITSLKGGLLIFCSVRTCLLALQVLELGLQLKNAHTRRHSRDTLKHLASVWPSVWLSGRLTLSEDTWRRDWKSWLSYKKWWKKKNKTGQVKPTQILVLFSSAGLFTWK